MGTVILAGLVGMLASLVGGVGVALGVWKIFSKRLVETKDVYEEPAKKRQILVPGDGVYTVHDKRKVRYIDEAVEYVKEQNKRL